MLLDEVGLDRPASFVFGRLVAEPVLDQPAGRLVDGRIAARAQHPAIGRAAADEHRVAHPHYSLRPSGLGRFGVVLVLDPAMDLPGRGAAPRAAARTGAVAAKA